MSHSPAPQNIPSPNAVFELSNRSFLRFSGTDRLRYLNGQVTQDLRRLKPEHPLPACVTNAKGRLQAVVWVTDFGDFILVDSDPGLSESLAARLERYIVADDVLLEDVTGQMGLFHFTGLTPDAYTELQRFTKTQIFRLGQPGWDVWVPNEDLVSVRALFASQLRSEADLEQLRIRQGIPKWGAELGEDTLPPEAGLDRTHIDYHKGCYIGQEVISRLKSVGHVNRSLVSLHAPSNGGIVPEPGTELFAPNSQPEGVLGKITSAVGGSEGEIQVLAYIKRGVSLPELVTSAGLHLFRRLGEGFAPSKGVD